MPAKKKASASRKKTAPKAKAAKKTAPKKRAARASKAGLAAGERYQCGVCGLAVTVDEECGCMEEHNLMCCGEVMEPSV